jgi:hypothetical protein
MGRKRAAFGLTTTFGLRRLLHRNAGVRSSADVEAILVHQAALLFAPMVGTKKMNLDADLARLADELQQNRHVFDLEWFRSSLGRNGHKVVANPAANDLIYLIEQALNERRPYSVIRLGDGEANLITYAGAQSTTPDLDWRVAAQIIELQADRFVPSPDLLLALRSSLKLSVLAANIVGVLGLWTRIPMLVDTVLTKLPSDPRGISGQIRGRYLALELPDLLPQSTVLASAHLYVGILLNLDRLLTAAKRVVCITGRDAAVAKLRSRHPDIVVDHVAVGSDPICDENVPSTPEFLNRVRDALPGDAQGVLHLVGSGPWSEIYCHWIKQRGGVSVDLGSGFDLLAGMSTRPIHRYIPDLFGIGQC